MDAIAVVGISEAVQQRLVIAKAELEALKSVKVAPVAEVVAQIPMIKKKCADLIQY